MWLLGLTRNLIWVWLDITSLSSQSLLIALLSIDSLEGLFPTPTVSLEPLLQNRIVGLFIRMVIVFLSLLSFYLSVVGFFFFFVSMLLAVWRPS